MNDWTVETEEPVRELSSFTEREQELLKNATLEQIKTYGRLDQPTLEAIIVGNLISEPDIDGQTPSIVAAEKIVEMGITREWFESGDLGGLFEDFMAHFRRHRKISSIEDSYNDCMTRGQTANQASMYKKMAQRCRAVAYIRNLNIDICLERMLMHHLMKVQNEIIERAQRERSDPKIGPRKSYENMRDRCIRDLLDPRGAVIKSFDLVQTGGETLNYLRDLKHHPEKYRGAVCGIQAIDSKTQGFRNGQLAVFVGGHGGFKTTMMMNVGYGLWERGANVLYASLEMEAQIVLTKQLCRATKLSYSRLYGGNIIEPEDWKRMDDLARGMNDAAGSEESRLKAKKEFDSLSSIIAKRTPQQADITVAEDFFKKAGDRKNRMVIVNVGQSQKMKMSQLERWLHEQSAMFKPDVIILDYLDLIEPERPNPDRLDVGFGDICKMSRAMGKNLGFSAITAAQMKRATIDRLRKTGLENPEKALFGTDDVSGSSMIGADADNMFILWRKGIDELLLFTVKSRYTGADNTKGEPLQVDHDTCTIGTKEQIQGMADKIKGKDMDDMIDAMGTLKTHRPSQIMGEEEDDAWMTETGPSEELFDSKGSDGIGEL